MEDQSGKVQPPFCTQGSMVSEGDTGRPGKGDSKVGLETKSATGGCLELQTKPQPG